ncbi:MAG: DNA polymerase III subunit delta' [Candidatus Hydrogenedens sp.]|nr:DNA polymerase III subunit delta' [Candidatus Hydrogenedens sp.]
MSFSQIKDQDVARRLLQGMCRRQRIPSGLLLWGPEGVGKTLAALEFAKAVNCESATGDACDECLSCRKTINRNHGDVLYVAPEGKGRLINVKSIEAMTEMVIFRPFEGGTRIVIISDADRMHEAAQNKFLKTLEEPPSKTVFVLITTSPRRLLPTILSRCHRIRFRALQMETVAALLQEKEGCSESRALAIAPLAQGSMMRALDLLHSDRREVVLDIVRRLSSGEDPLMISESFATHLQEKEKQIANAIKAEWSGKKKEGEESQELDKEALEALVVGRVRREAREYLRLFDSWYRDALVKTVDGDDTLVFNRDHSGDLQKNISSERQALKLAAINEAAKYIERNMQSQRVFRDLFFELSRPALKRDRATGG